MTEYADKTPQPTDHLDVAEVIARSAEQVEVLARSLAARALTAPLDTLEQWELLQQRSGDIAAVIRHVREAVATVQTVPAELAQARAQLAVAPVVRPEFGLPKQADLYEGLLHPDAAPPVEAVNAELIPVSVVTTKHLRIGESLVAIDGDLLYTWNALVKKRQTPATAEELGSFGYRHAARDITPEGAVLDLIELFEQFGYADAVIARPNMRRSAIRYQLNPRVMLAVDPEAQSVHIESAPYYRSSAEGLNRAQMLSLAGLKPARNWVFDKILTPAELEQTFFVPGSEEPYMPLQVAHQVIRRIRESELVPDDHIPIDMYRLSWVYPVLPGHMSHSRIQSELRKAHFAISLARVPSGDVRVLEQPAFDHLFAVAHQQRGTKLPVVTDTATSAARAARTPIMPAAPRMRGDAVPSPLPLPAEPLPPAQITPETEPEPQVSPTSAEVTPEPVVVPEVVQVDEPTKTPADVAPAEAPAAEAPAPVSAGDMLRQLLKSMHGTPAATLAKTDGHQPESTTDPGDASEQEQPVAAADVVELSDFNGASSIAVALGAYMRQRHRSRGFTNRDITNAANRLQDNGREFPLRRVAPNGTLEYSREEAGAIITELLRAHGMLSH